MSNLGNKPFWEFKNSADAPNEATLYIYGDIVTYDLGYWNWPDDVVPNKFRKELAALEESVNTIHVRINSSGGSVFAAYAIMNLLKSHKARIISYNDGICASAGTFIALAGDRIVSALGSVWMYHLPEVSPRGSLNRNALQKLGEILVTIEATMLDIYESRTGLPRAELEKLINEDTWLSGKEAHEKGLVDEVTDMKVDAYLNADNQSAFFNGLTVSLDLLRNKDSLVAMLSSKAPMPQNSQPTPPASLSPPNNEQEETVMNLTDFKEKHSDIYAAAVNEGIEQGTAAERARIQAIDDMALPGMEALTSKAKFESGITAGEFAVELIKAQKKKGESFLNDVKADADEVDDIPANPQPDGNQEEEALLAHAAEHAKTIRR